ncbi:MAG: HIT family protein [Jatrophihabitans sp.]|uniref:HIT family protein n=1 Tax=Jatrophihabitans sp. TaxID=1932789 RepID=UPI003F7F77AD
MGCVFCAIVAGDAPAHRVHEDEHTLAFLDIRPLAPAHTLVVPKTHAPGLADLDPDAGRHAFATAQHVGRAMRHAPINADGVNLVLNDGRAAAQTVFHVHIHVVPRFAGDKLRLAKQVLRRRPGDLEATAEQVRRALAAGHSA